MEKEHTDSVLLAQTIVRENPSVEDAGFFFEYRLVLPDDEFQSCALQRRRVDTVPSGQQQGEWAYRHFAKTVWQLLWEYGELWNADIQSCHPITTFARDAYARVSAIDQVLSTRTEQGLREDFEERFQERTRRLRNPQRIAAIGKTLLQEFKKENAARLELCNTLQAEREPLIQGVNAPQLLLGGQYQ